MLWTVINLRQPLLFSSESWLEKFGQRLLAPTYMGSRPSMVTRSVGKKGSLAFSVVVLHHMPTQIWTMAPAMSRVVLSQLKGLPHLE
jgi:hypothetical protein